MKTIVKIKFGSHLYGTNTSSSDQDYKSVYIPDARDILLGTTKETIHTSTGDSNSRNTSDDVDTETFTIKQYLKLLMEGQTIALDMLFAPDDMILESSDEWELIRSNKDKFLHSGILAFVGYCRQQANKYGIKGSRVAAAREAVRFFTELMDKYDPQDRLGTHWDMIVEWAENREHIEIVNRPCKKTGNNEQLLMVCNRMTHTKNNIKYTLEMYQKVLDSYGMRAMQAEENEGIDWKALSHAVRVLKEAKELLMTGNVTFPCPDRDLLLDIKLGELDYKTVAKIIEDGMEELEELKKHSTLPDEPDYAFADDIVCRIYKDVITRS